MSRDTTTAFDNATLESVVRPLLFMEGEFDSGFLRFWSGLGEITWDGKTWTGGGGVIGFSPPDETADTRASGGTITLNGIDSSVISTVLGEAVQGKPVKAWLGLLADDGSIIADPYLWMSGRLDVPEITDAGETCAISVSVENRLQAVLERAPDRRFTSESHKLEYPDDEFFSFVPSIQDANIPWGRGS